MSIEVKWSSGGLTVPDFANDIINGAKDVAAFLEAVSKLLEALAPFLVLPEDALKAVINALLSALQGFINDLLNNNIAFCIHFGYEYDTRWSYVRDPRIANSRYAVHDAGGEDKWEIPIKGKGLAGFLSDIAASMNNPNDPWAPRIEAGSPLVKGSGDTATEVPTTMVACVMFLKVIPDVSNLSAIKKLFDSLMSSKKEAQDAWKEIDEDHAKSMASMGEAFKDCGSSMNSLFTSGDGTEAHKAKIAQLKEDTGAFGSFLLPDTSGDTADTFLDSFTADMPFWRSVPMAAMFGPPVEDFFRALKTLIEKLKYPVDDELSRLVRKLAKKIQTLSDLIDEIADLILAVETLINYLLTAEMLTVVSTEGFTASIPKILSHDDLPASFKESPSGIVFGTVALINLDSGLDNFTKMLEAFGQTFENIADSYQSTADGVAEAWEEFVDEESGTAKDLSSYAPDIPATDPP